jgi:hypothetical protein
LFTGDLPAAAGLARIARRQAAEVNLAMVLWLIVRPPR